MNSNNFSLSAALITSSLTLAGGLIAFVLGQFLLKYIIEPLTEYRRVKASVSIALVFYSNTFLNPIEINDENLKNESLRNELSEVRTSLRRLASELTGCVQIIPLYFLFFKIGVIPSRKKLLEVSTNLIGISNNLWKNSMFPNNSVEKNNERSDKIIQILNLEHPD